jgi:hypothetical protein
MLYTPWVVAFRRLASGTLMMAGDLVKPLAFFCFGNQAVTLGQEGRPGKKKAAGKTPAAPKGVLI